MTVRGLTCFGAGNGLRRSRHDGTPARAHSQSRRGRCPPRRRGTEDTPEAVRAAGPTLAVEVPSESNAPREMARAIGECFAAGAELVGIIPLATVDWWTKSRRLNG